MMRLCAMALSRTTVMHCRQPKRRTAGAMWYATIQAIQQTAHFRVSGMLATTAPSAS